MKHIKGMFPGYYRPKDAEFSELWRSSIFVFDTNVFLNLYRYDADTRNELLKILTNISELGRLWIPHQVALEYYENRRDVIDNLEKSYDEVKEHLKTNYDRIKKDLETYTRHPVLTIDDLIEKLNENRRLVEDEVDKLKKNHPKWTDNDEIQKTLEDLLDGNVGPQYTRSEIEDVYKEGELRYTLKIPPGYRDAETKRDFTKYGDLILWHQMMDKSKKEATSIIFITDDVKDDWWLKIKGERAPRPELIQEFVSETNNQFYMYPVNRFMDWAKEYLDIEINRKAIGEIEKVRKSDEISFKVNVEPWSEWSYTLPKESDVKMSEWAENFRGMIASIILLSYLKNEKGMSDEDIKNFIDNLKDSKNDSTEDETLMK